MILEKEYVYQIRFIESNGKMSTPSYLKGEIALMCILDFLEERNMAAYFTVHNPVNQRQNDTGNCSYIRYTEENCDMNPVFKTLNSKRENALGKKEKVSGSEIMTTQETMKVDVRAKTRNTLRRRAIVITIWIVCFSNVLKVGNTMSCRESLTTLSTTQSCPSNSEEWRVAAIQKRCSEVRQKCCSPDDFEYHCLINAFGNETVEVCAPRKRTSYCAEFNSLGARIQANFQMNCTNNTVHCEKFYYSTEMFKVPQCLRIWRYTVNSTTTDTTRTASLKSSTTTSARSDMATDVTSKEQNTELRIAEQANLLNTLLPILGTFILVLLFIPIACCILKIQRKTIETIEKMPFLKNA